MDKTRILMIVLVFLGAILGTCVHEFGHALAAYYAGDKSVKEKGYLTMNPLKYTHPLLSIGLPLLFLVLGGLPLPGGAVYIDHSRIKEKYMRSLVALAGPLGTLVFTVVIAVPFLLGIPKEPTPVWSGLALLVFVEVAAFFLNLVPVPPLDGWRILEPYLPHEIRQGARSLGFLGIVGLIVLIRIPFIASIFWLAVFFTITVLRVPVDWVGDGFNLFKFWGS